MTESSIYDYANTQEFLLAVFKGKQRINPRFSLRSWSRQLGLNNPMILSRVFRGQSKLQPHVARQIAEKLAMPQDDGKFFEFLTLCEAAQTAEEKALYQDLLLSIKPEHNLTWLEVDQFRMISDWYYFPILEMTQLKGFRSDPEWIAEKLGHGLTSEIVKMAIERMLRLGILKRDAKGKLRKKSPGRVWAGDRGEREKAVNLYHAQMMKRGESAIEGQNVNERFFSSMTLPVRKKDLEKLKKLIEKFNKSLARQAAPKDEGEEIYHVNLQVFRATEKENRP